MFKKISLWQQVLISLVLGIVCGIWLPEIGMHLKPIGTIFLRCIMMLAPIMIFTSLTSGILSVKNDQIANIGLKAFITFLLVSLFAAIFGLSISWLLKPGLNIPESLLVMFKAKNSTVQDSFSFVEMIINIFPENIFQTFASNNFIQIVFFACFLGINLNAMPENNQLRQLINDSLNLILRMISQIMKFAPYATFSLIAYSFAAQGTDLLKTLSKLVATISITMALQYLLFGIFIKIFAKLSPWPFYKKSIEYQAIAFSTSSSKITLPVTIKVCQNNLGMSHPACNFILPLGASINMSGLVINLVIITTFVAQALGINLMWKDYLTIVSTTILCSIGGAGIPGASLIMMPIVFSSVNLPIEGVVIFAGIDRLMDMLRTTINITGDAAVALILDARDNKLDKEKYMKL